MDAGVCLEVIRNDIFHFAYRDRATGSVGYANKTSEPLYSFLPNLLEVAEGNNDAIPTHVSLITLLLALELFEPLKMEILG